MYMLQKIHVPHLSNKTLIRLLVASIVLFCIASFFFYQAVYKNPERVFTAMLSKNLSTAGYTRTIDSSSSDAQMIDSTQAQFGAQNVVEGKTSLKQYGSVVKTHVIGTPKTELVRYTEIEQGTVNEQNQKTDFSGILNKWASYGEGVPPQSFTQAQLGLFPIGNLSPKNKQKILAMIHKDKVFQPNYDTVKTVHQNGRLLYVYDVTIYPEAYIKVLKQFGEAVGLHEQVAQFDESQYKGAEPLHFMAGVDVVSRRLTTLASAGNTSSHEKYDGYGIQHPVTLPRADMTVQELQQRLSKLQ